MNHKLSPTAVRSFSKLVLFLTLVCSVVVCLIAQQPAHATPENPIVVSLGDSYSAGEGNEPFYGQDKPIVNLLPLPITGITKVTDPDWLAHRSTISWPGALLVPSGSSGTYTNLKNNKDRTWFFVAASGAETKHILSERQAKPYKQGLLGLVATGTGYLPKQIDVFSSKGLKGKVDYVTLTIGGNDLGFSDIINAAARDTAGLLSGTLDAKISSAWAKYNSSIKAKIKDTYQKIRAAAGSQATLIVVGYPTLISQHGGGGIFSSDEAHKINKAALDLNVELKGIVSSLNDPKIVFVDVADKFRGHEAYTTDEYINQVLGLQSQDLDQSLTLDLFGVLKISSYSIHPNAKGIAKYTEAVQEVIGGAPITSLVFDVSTPINPSSVAVVNAKLAAIRTKGASLVSTIKEPKPLVPPANIGVVKFAAGASEVLAPTKNYNNVSSAINNLNIANGTNILAGIEAGIAQLKNWSGPKTLILVSTSKDSVGNSKAAILAAVANAKNAGIKINTVGLGAKNDIDEALLGEIAATTGGTYNYEATASLANTIPPQVLQENKSWSPYYSSIKNQVQKLLGSF